MRAVRSAAEEGLERQAAVRRLRTGGEFPGGGVGEESPHRHGRCGWAARAAGAVVRVGALGCEPVDLVAGPAWSCGRGAAPSKRRRETRSGFRGRGSFRRPPSGTTGSRGGIAVGTTGGRRIGPWELGIRGAGASRYSWRARVGIRGKRNGCASGYSWTARVGIRGKRGFSTGMNTAITLCDQEAIHLRHRWLHRGCWRPSTANASRQRLSSRPFIEIGPPGKPAAFATHRSVPAAP